MKVADNEQATTGALAKSEADCVSPSRRVNDLTKYTQPIEMNMANSNVSLEGTALLNDPVHNRGTAFTEEERTSHHLEGLLPAAVDDLPTQLKRVLGHLSAKPTALEQYIYLQDLCDRNETLFYTTLMSDPARFVPIVYDPTIADACLTYGHIYRRPQGMYLNKRMRGRFAKVLANWPVKDIRFICVSYGSSSLASTIGAPRQVPIRNRTRRAAALASAMGRRPARPVTDGHLPRRSDGARQ